MSVYQRITHGLLFPVRTRSRLFISFVLVVLLTVGGWYGVRYAQFRAHWKAAELALAEYQFLQARTELDHCLRLRPKHNPTLLLAAQAARRDGDLVKAEQFLDQHRERVGEAIPENTLERAMLIAQKGKVQEVVDFLGSRVDAGHPATEQILEALAVGCVVNYQLHRASFWVSELLTRFPKNLMGRLIFAQSTETLGNKDKSMSLLRELHADYPNNPKVLVNLGHALFRDQKYEDAVNYFKQDLAIRPHNLETLLGLIRCYERMSRSDDIRPLIAVLQEFHPNNPDAMIFCGRFYSTVQQPQQAEPLLRKAIELAPFDPEANLQLGICLQQLGRGEEAKIYSEKARVIEVDLHRLEKVVEAMVKAPNDPAPRLEAASICLKNGQHSEGLRWIAGVLEQDPKNKPAHSMMVDYYTAQGNTLLAEQHSRYLR